jgi:hypothetical protein
MYMSQTLDQLRRNELELGNASPPRQLHAPELSPGAIQKKAGVSEAQCASLRSIIRSCVVRHFCGNVVGVRRKAVGNVSLCTAEPEINILQAIRQVSGAASDLLNELTEKYAPPPQFKEVRVCKPA